MSAYSFWAALTAANFAAVSTRIAVLVVPAAPASA